MPPSIDTTEYALAIQSVKRFKNLLLLLFLLTVLVQGAAFVLLEFTDVLNAPPPKNVAVEAADEESTSTSADVETLCPVWSETLHWALPATKFFALVFSGLLAMVLMLAVKLSLLGRGAGTRRFLGAFFWSLILLAIVVPWQQVYHGNLACGALYSFGELIRGHNAFHALTTPTVADAMFYYARFLAYPTVVLLVWLLVAIRSAGGAPVRTDSQATS